MNVLFFFFFCKNVWGKNGFEKSRPKKPESYPEDEAWSSITDDGKEWVLPAMNNVALRLHDVTSGTGISISLQNELVEYNRSVCGLKSGRSIVSWCTAYDRVMGKRDTFECWHSDPVGAISCCISPPSFARETLSTSGSIWTSPVKPGRDVKGAVMCSRTAVTVRQGEEIKTKQRR